MQFDHTQHERVLFIVSILAIVSLLGFQMKWLSHVATVSDVIVGGFVFFSVAKTFKSALLEREQVAILISLGFLSILILTFRDIYVFARAGIAENQLPESTMMQYSMVILLLVLFVILVTRFIEALNESEQLNAELEQRISQATLSLEKSYAENRELELKATAMNERQKIYRDLHDDVGAKLVTIIHSGAQGRQVDLARDALSSLRDVVAQNSEQYQELSTVIISSVSEMELRLSNADIALRTEGVDSLPEIIFDPQIGYHMSRIIREVTTNIMKHAVASQVEIHVKIQNGKFSCCISDDGKGLDEAAVEGSGLNNIRYRASEIGAKVVWQPGTSKKGCSFCLSLVLHV